jgi:hypothetical protein
MHITSVYLGLINQASNSISNNKHRISINLLIKAINYSVIQKRNEAIKSQSKRIWLKLTEPLDKLSILA